MSLVMEDNTMFKRLDKAIVDAIKEVIEEHDYMFDKWWTDIFDTEVFYDTEEEFKNLSDTDLEIVKFDWIAEHINTFELAIYNAIYIKPYNTLSKYHTIILEELHEIIKDMLFKRLSK